MAAIDKTYTNKWSDYEALVRWAEGKEFVAKNGLRLRPIDYIYEWDKKDWNGKEVPVMNTPEALDYFLVKECPLQFVQDRMKEVYGSEWYEEVRSGTSYYDSVIYVDSVPVTLAKNRKIVWVNKPKHNKIPEGTYLTLYGMDSDWPLTYSRELGRWLLEDEIKDCYGDDLYVGGMTWKAVIRKLRNMPLPSMAVIKCGGYDVPEHKLIILW